MNPADLAQRIAGVRKCMAQRAEKMAADKRRNFWRVLDAAEVTRDHRGMFFRALDMRETMQDIKRIDRRGGPQRQGLHPMDPARIGHDIGTNGWHREQALYADKTGIRTDGTGLPRQDDIGGQAFNGSKYNAEEWAQIIKDTNSHVPVILDFSLGWGSRPITGPDDEVIVKLTCAGVECKGFIDDPIAWTPTCSNCGVAVDDAESWCAACCRNERGGS